MPLGEHVGLALGGWDRYGLISNVPTDSGDIAIAGGESHNLALLPEPNTGLLLTTRRRLR